jgi:hypothetical protein
MEYVVPLTNVTEMLLGIDGTHLTMCGSVFGSATNQMPGFTLMQGSHNGGGVTEPQLKAIGFDIATRKFVDLGTHKVGGSYDRHLYSNYLGNNPGNQGRNFAGCALVKNPFVGQNGSTSTFFVAHALTGKSPEFLARPELKPSSFVSMMPVATTVATTQQGLEAAESEGVGCTTATGAGSGEALLVFACLGLFCFIRRRSA